jgi:tetratricopeptide (TPR) repeat protein
MHHVGFSYLGSRRYKEAIVEFRRTLEVHADWVWGHAKLAMALAYDGQSDAALESLDKAEELIAQGGDTPLLRSWLGVARAQAGDEAGARACLEKMQAQAKDGWVDPVELAELLCALGETENALSLLERGYADRSPSMCWVPVLFIFDRLRDEPRYQSLIDKLNIPQKAIEAA